MFGLWVPGMRRPEHSDILATNRLEHGYRPLKEGRPVRAIVRKCGYLLRIAKLHTWNSHVSLEKGARHKKKCRTALVSAYTLEVQILLFNCFPGNYRSDGTR